MSKSQENEFGDKNNLETGPKWAQFGPEKFFDDWNHQYQLEIIAVYHNVQNEKKHMSTSRDIEFGDKNNLETGLKWGWKIFLMADTTGGSKKTVWIV